MSRKLYKLVLDRLYRKLYNVYMRCKQFISYGIPKEIKRKAHQAVKRAVDRGEILPAAQQYCSCGRTGFVLHHESYDKDKWLDVEPLCYWCHRDRHEADLAAFKADRKPKTPRAGKE